MLLTEFQVPHTLPGWAPLGMSAVFAQVLMHQLREARRESARGQWVKGTLEVTGVRQQWSDAGEAGSTPGASAYAVIGRLRTHDGRVVEAESSDVIGGTAARSAVGRPREAWYLPEHPTEVRLAPPVGHGYLRAVGPLMALTVAAILFGVYATFWL